MIKGKRIVLSTFGSFGDIHPYIAIALELKSRGHTPVMATSEVYREKMVAAGIQFYPIRPNMPSYDDTEEMLRLSVELMNPRGGTEKVLQLVAENPREVYEDLDAAVEGADLLLTHPLPFVGPIVAQKRGLPWVSSVLAPISFFSSHDPPVLPQLPSLYHLMKRSWAASRLAYRIASSRLENIMEPIYRLRAELGLPRGAQPLLVGQHSPTMVLALFSPLLARPQPDWPANTRVTGFPFYDRRDFFGETEAEPALMKFLADGPPPIVFTLGSAAFWVADQFYRDSIKAAQELGQRALLLIGHARNRPTELLPAGMAVFEYAPFGEVFPRASVIVHQGGVGTTGQGLRSGRAVLIVPHAHDQFDNAARVVRLGCGRMVARPRYNARTAIRELGAILENPSAFTRAKEVGERVRNESGARSAADAIEEVLLTHN
ncbi:MAG: glycosyltransferase family 1 protein [Pyrinomonadaceae bacterium]|nr:glycosyltransferase family 1 protein [Pyrinomonadaceae bacterium]